MTEYIVRDGDTGRALVSSTNTPVDEILQALQDGGQFDSALQRHPGLTPQGVAAALRFARLAVERGGRPAQQKPSDAGFVGVQEVPVHVFNQGDGVDGGFQVGFGTLEDSLRAAAERRDQLRYELDLVESIHAGLEDVAAGRVIPHEEVMARLRARFPG